MPNPSEHYSTATEGGRPVCRRLTVRGRIEAASYLAFVAERAAWLSLDGEGSASAGGVTLLIAGPEALVGAFEMACTLGPLDALVHEITGIDETAHPAPGFRIA